MTTAARLIYVGDPMCSWCWGFAPELERIEATFDVELIVVTGGLRPGADAQPLDERLAGFLRTEWSKIHDVTGQPFSFDALEWTDWIYDTEVPAAAVAFAREVGLGSVVSFMSRVQRAFYAESVDITRPESFLTLWDYEDETGVTAQQFVDELRRTESRERAYSDFRRARAMGIRGFPALVFERDGTPPVRRMVAYGYQPADHITPVIEHLLAGEDAP